MSTEDEPDENIGPAVVRQDSWTEEDEARWQAELRDGEPPWLTQLLDAEAARMQADIARDAQDELAARRYMNELKDRHQRLTSAELARMDVEIAVFSDAEKALREGREAFARGEVELAESRLRVAAAHGMGDAVVYLAALYRSQHRDDLATAWWTIAKAEGFGERDLIEVDRLG